MGSNGWVGIRCRCHFGLRFLMSPWSDVIDSLRPPFRIFSHYQGVAPRHMPRTDVYTVQKKVTWISPIAPYVGRNTEQSERETTTLA